MSLFQKVFGSRQPNTIEIVHGKDRHLLRFADGAIEDGTITVGTLRAECTKITSLPVENVKLLYRGKLLTNNNVKVVATGMKSGSRVLCIASLPPDGAGEKSTHTNRTGVSAATIKQVTSPAEMLADLLLVIQTDLEPSVKQFITQVPEDPRQRKETHDQLAELLLQKLFALDGITCQDDADEDERLAIRTKRKEGVTYTQGLLDSVDAVITPKEPVIEAESTPA